MQELILFVAVCLAIGVALRMAMGQSASTAIKNTGRVFVAPAKVAAKIGVASVKASQRR